MLKGLRETKSTMLKGLRQTKSSMLSRPEVMGMAVEHVGLGSYERGPVLTGGLSL